MVFSTFLIRSVGGVSLGVAAYEMNHHSKEHAVEKTREHTAKHLTDLYINHTTNTNGHSHTEHMKNEYRKWVLDDNYIPHLQYTKNRILGFRSGLLDNILIFGLGACALMARSQAKLNLYKGFVAKPLAGAAAVVLSLLAATNFTKNVLGWGHGEPPGFYP